MRTIKRILLAIWNHLVGESTDESEEDAYIQTNAW